MSEWISVEDRLPKQEQGMAKGVSVNVLTYKRDEGFDVGFHMGNSWFDDAADTQIPTPTHWMPLPSPPKEETK